MPRKKLPIGIQTFSEIREQDYYYVDKTALACQLAQTGKAYFLSRPRRFGKSLLISTFAELFAGNAPLFQGLAAESQWEWSNSHPVIQLSFGGGVLHTREILEQVMTEQINDHAERLGVVLKHQSLSGRFAELIRKAAEQYRQKTVVLIDEYDKPILDNLTQPELARVMRDALRNLYSVLKDSDAHLRFVFLTGVSKFSKVNLFSGLNHLRDITLSSEYSSLCGYTDADLDEVFAPELPGLDRDEIRRWYNGYNWLGESVYNPFDVLLLFQERDFRNYWFETGTPTFLIDLLIQRRIFMPALEQLQSPESLLSAFEVDHIGTEALLWQAGYLTIDKVRRIGAVAQYQLRYPNLEVRSSLTGTMLSNMRPDPAEHGVQMMQLYDLLLALDFNGLHHLIHSLFASIPYEWQRSNPIAHYEGYYASVFYSYFAALGLDIRLEDITNKGRIDMTVLFNEQVFLFEFKVVEEVPEGKALAQLKQKGYAEKYRALNQPIYLIGVEFSKVERQLVAFEVEPLAQV